MKENDEEENENDNKENSLIIDEKNKEEIKIEDKEHQDLILEENIFNVKSNKENYNEQINYSNENPFTATSIVGFGITMGGGGISITSLIFGSTFALSALSISGLIISGIGIVVFIPSLIGLGIYKLYKKRNDEDKKYFNSLKNDESMKEEREIYLDIINYLKRESINSFEKDYQTQYNNELSNKINNYIQNFIKKKEDDFQKLINENKKQVQNISKLNIMLLGNSGVGKSTLVNEILGLENNKAEEQTNNERMLIDGWTKKYPVNEKDTKIKNINLWDTEGIEYSQEQKNDQENHINKVINHINNHKSIPGQQINCIWFCIHGQTFQPSEMKYIEKLLDVYNEKFKIPIIFIYTQSYEIEYNNVEALKKKLENMEFYKNNKNQFHFIDIIAKKKTFKSRKTGKEESEPPFNLEKLMEETFSLAKEGIELIVKDKINRLNYQLNKDAKEFKEKIDKDIINLINEILKDIDNKLIDIFESTKQYLINLISNIFGFEKNQEKENIDKIIDIIRFIIKGKIENNLNNIKYDYIVKFFDSKIISEYNEKKEPKDNINIFKKKVCDNIIKPIFYCRKNYAMMEIYNIVLNLILKPLYEKYGKSLSFYKNKIEKTFLDISNKNYNEFIKNSNINK